MEGTTPKSLSQLLQEAWQIYKEKFNTLLLLVAVLLFPLYVITDFAPKPALPEDYIFTLGPGPESVTAFQDLAPAEFFSQFLQYFSESATAGVWVGYGAQMLAWVASILLSIAVVFVVAKTVRKQPVAFVPVLRESLRFWWPTLLTTLLSGIILFLIFAVFAIPAFFYAAYWVITLPVFIIMALAIFWTFIVPSVALTDKRYIAALGYSMQLVKGRWFQVFGRMLVVGLLVGLIIVFLSFITASVLEVPMLEAVAGFLFEMISLYASVFLVVYFLDLEAQKKPHNTTSQLS